MALTFKQQKFVDAYVGEANGNASKAARMAGYAAPYANAHRLMEIDGIREAISEFYRQNAMPAEEVVSRLTDHAKGSLAPFLAESPDGEVYIDLATDEAREHLHLLKKAKTKRRKYGRGDDDFEVIETEIELHDPQAALVQLGRHHKLFTDKTEQELKVDGILGYRITPPDTGSGDGHPGG